MKWKPRYSLRSLLVVMVALSLLLGLRLLPRHNARRFLELSQAEGVQRALLRLDPEDRESLQTYCHRSGWPKGSDARAGSSSWETLRDGFSKVIVPVRWDRLNSYGVDEIEITFHSDGSTSYEVQTVERQNAPFIIL